MRLCGVLITAAAIALVDRRDSASSSCLQLHLGLSEYADDISVAFVGRQLERVVHNQVGDNGTALLFHGRPGVQGRDRPPHRGPHPRPGIRSNVLIAYVADEEGRAGVVQSVLEDARQEKIDLITSALSITEVAYYWELQP